MNSVKVTTGIVKAPTSVSMNVDTKNVLSADGKHYYIFVGDTLPVNVSFNGEQFFYAEEFEVATTNSSVAVVEEKGTNSFVVRGIQAGTIDVSMTTTGLLTDSVKVTVLDESDITLIGDVDFDGQITVHDLNRIYAVVQGTAEKTKIFDYADINEDGQLDMNDVQALMEQLGYTGFVDVNETDWFYDTVDFVYENGIMTGMDDIHFGPYGTLSRAQFALILYRMAGEPEYNKDRTFSDISGDEWYGPAVLWAGENNIIAGYVDGRFGPGDPVTREQISVLLYRYARYSGYSYDESADLSRFVDAQSLSQFAYDSMQWAIGKGIITGKENGTIIDPQGATARAEAATIIKRFMDIYE